MLLKSLFSCWFFFLRYQDSDSEDESGDLKAAMIGSQKTPDEKMTESALSIFSDSKAITSQQFSSQQIR